MIILDEQKAISMIRKYANNFYNDGWDIVVESFSDGDILEYLSNNGMDISKTIDDIQETIDLRKEMADNCRE